MCIRDSKEEKKAALRQLSEVQSQLGEALSRTAHAKMASVLASVAGGELTAAFGAWRVLAASTGAGPFVTLRPRASAARSHTFSCPSAPSAEHRLSSGTFP